MYQKFARGLLIEYDFLGTLRGGPALYDMKFKANLLQWGRLSTQSDMTALGEASSCLHSVLRLPTKNTSLVRVEESKLVILRQEGQVTEG